MTRDELLALADSIAQGDGRIGDYVTRIGMKYSTLLSRAWRRGIKLGTEIRRRRVALVEQEARTTGRSLAAIAIERGWWAEGQHFYRARRKLRQQVA
jgi:hypothetical protein